MERSSSTLGLSPKFGEALPGRRAFQFLIVYHGRSSKMRKRRLSLIAAVILVSISCSKPKPTIVLDRWWSIDFAKNACEQANQWHQQNAALIAQVGCEAVTSCPELMPRVEACISDPAIEVRDFETELATQLAADPNCAAVQLVIYDGHDDSEKGVSESVQGPHWQLSLDFEPGDRKQHWAMIRSPSLNALTSGTGNPKEIATAVCAVVSERGAKLLN